MPSPRPDSNWVARLRSQPYFNSIESVWQQNGIPDWVAEGVISNEDTSLDLGATGSDAPSVGLYQINLDAHPDVTRAEASDPTWSSQWFAQVVAPILTADPELKDPANVPVLVRKLEEAGWPGSGALATLEYPQRLSDMQAVIAQNSNVSSQPQPTKGQYENPFSNWWHQFTKGLGSLNPIMNAQEQFNSAVHAIGLVLLGIVLVGVAIIWLSGHEIADALRQQATTNSNQQQNAPAVVTGESKASPATEIAEDALVA